MSKRVITTSNNGVDAPTYDEVEVEDTRTNSENTPSRSLIDKVRDFWDGY